MGQSLEYGSLLFPHKHLEHRDLFQEAFRFGQDCRCRDAIGDTERGFQRLAQFMPNKPFLHGRGDPRAHAVAFFGSIQEKTPATEVTGVLQASYFLQVT